MIKTGDLVAVFDRGSQKIGLKCRSSKNENEFALKVKCADGAEASVCVSPVCFEGEIGVKALTTDTEFSVVAMCGSKPSFISMAWIDEASPDYHLDEDEYEDGISYFQSVISKFEKYTSSCQSPKDESSGTQQGIEYCIYKDGDYPSDYGLDIKMENIGRADAGLTNEQLTDMFDTLLSDFQSKDPTSVTEPEYVVLVVDNSTSMYTSTIEPAYSNLKSYILATIPSITIIEDTFTREDWLHKWAEKLLNI